MSAAKQEKRPQPIPLDPSSVADPNAFDDSHAKGDGSDPFVIEEVRPFFCVVPF